MQPSSRESRCLCPGRSIVWIGLDFCSVKMLGKHNLDCVGLVCISVLRSSVIFHVRGMYDCGKELERELGETFLLFLKVKWTYGLLRFFIVFLTSFSIYLFIYFSILLYSILLQNSVEHC